MGSLLRTELERAGEKVSPPDWQVFLHSDSSPLGGAGRHGGHPGAQSTHSSVPEERPRRRVGKDWKRRLHGFFPSRHAARAPLGPRRGSPGCGGWERGPTEGWVCSTLRLRALRTPPAHRDVTWGAGLDMPTPGLHPTSPACQRLGASRGCSDLLEAAKASWFCCRPRPPAAPSVRTPPQCTVARCGLGGFVLRGDGSPAGCP